MRAVYVLHPPDAACDLNCLVAVQPELKIRKIRETAATSAVGAFKLHTPAQPGIREIRIVPPPKFTVLPLGMSAGVEPARLTILYMRNNLRTLVIMATLASVAVVAAPALAQEGLRSAAVSMAGKYVGQDPDAHVRYEVIRDWQLYAGGGNE